MAWIDHVPFPLPFWADKKTYQVPWVKLRTEAGDLAEGPMVRQGRGRREILTWTDRSAALRAAQELVATTGGSFDIKAWDRKAVQDECRRLSSWGSKVVAVVLK